MSKSPFTVIERFWQKVEKTDTCWLWTGAISSKGYGVFTVRGEYALAHRVSYEMLVGPIPEGLQLDHVKARGCVNRHCVNPAHLEPVTCKVNLGRGRNKELEKTHCPQGHEYSGSNLYIDPQGGRRCIACRNISKLKWQLSQNRSFV